MSSRLHQIWTSLASASTSRSKASDDDLSRPWLSVHQDDVEEGTSSPISKTSHKGRSHLLLFASIILSLSALSWFLSLILTQPPYTTQDSESSHLAKLYFNASRGPHWHDWHSVRNLIAFGDSWTSTGFQINGTHPNALNPIGNPPWPGSTTANGANWIGFLTSKYNASLVMTTNYALGGAMIDPDDKYKTDAFPHFRREIIEDFALRTSKYSWTADDSLIALWVGVNNVIFNTEGSAAVGARYAQTFEQYFELIRFLHRTGGRNFLILNAAPLDKAPIARVVRMEDEYALRVAEWNERVVDMCERASRELADSTILRFDVHKLIDDIITEPRSFSQTAGVEVVNATCPPYMNGTPEWDTFYEEECEYSVDKYLWLNDFHPSTYLHNATAWVLAQALAG